MRLHSLCGIVTTQKFTGDGADKSAVLLQHEDDGRSLLTLQASGQYNTYINAQNVASNKAVQKVTGSMLR